ncbi:hypothetical protein ETD85_09245 [Nonomuraea zeae]|uniref:Uncharacterized protein n=1 Tax=Nonomuraea zeae TaxID=1642303 RepID=A0A5S4GVY7_9ACTN|nr:hypothetical protein ETD85_09245 [Nonomuraea zeae]
MPEQPAARAAGIDSRTRDAAPRAEPALPPRNRVAATTGAANGVDNVTASTFRPRTSTLLPPILVWPNPEPCLV